MSARRKRRDAEPKLKVQRTETGRFAWRAMLPDDEFEASESGFATPEQADEAGRLWLEARRQTVLRLAP